MRKLLAGAAVVMLSAGAARAGDPLDGVNGGTRIIEWLSGRPVAPNPAAMRLQPVVGSVRLAPGHFNNPFTHKVRYSALMFNPLHGTFSTLKFKR